MGDVNIYRLPGPDDGGIGPRQWAFRTGYFFTGRPSLLFPLCAALSILHSPSSQAFASCFLSSPAQDFLSSWLMASSRQFFNSSFAACETLQAKALIDLRVEGSSK